MYSVNLEEKNESITYPSETNAGVGEIILTENKEAVRGTMDHKSSTEAASSSTLRADISRHPTFRLRDEF